MAVYIARRFFILLGTLFLVSAVVFLVLNVLPGDPAQLILGLQATPEALRELRHQLGLDLPLHVQYLRWIGGLLRGDLGRSIVYDVPVQELIAARLSVTVPLAFLSILFALVVSIPLGIYAARHRNRPGDYGVMAFAQIGLVVPAFWAGILLILLFSVHLHWFSAGGFRSWSHPEEALKSLLLPALSLGLIRAAVLARMTRSSLLDTLGEDYIRTARSKGLAETVVVYRHALRNSLIPVITVLGLQIGELLAGAIVIENVFNLPGLGRLAFLAIKERDLPVVQGVTLLVAGLIVIINFIVDIAYGAVDPRIRLGGEES